MDGEHPGHLVLDLGTANVDEGRVCRVCEGLNKFFKSGDGSDHARVEQLSPQGCFVAAIGCSRQRQSGE